MVEKMRYYKMSTGLIKRIIRFPQRKEVGIAPGTVAVMKPTQTKRKQEYWVMYKHLPDRRRRIISAWRYPGVSLPGESIPIPDDILKELEGII